MKHLSGNGKQQVITDGNPYLRVYRILARSVERLDVQMLFDPFEETFHLPTFPIKFSNGQVRMCEVIGQEPIDISREATNVRSTCTKPAFLYHSPYPNRKNAVESSVSIF